LFAAYFGVTEEGNFEGENILHISRPADVVAREAGVTAERLRAALERGSQILFAAREKRIKPGRDEKVLTGWNGMMLASFAEAAAILDRPDYLAVAERNAGFILDTLRIDGKLLHTFKDGQAKLQAYQDDYAQLAAGLLSLYEVTGTYRWLEAALTLTGEMNREFWDGQGGGYFYTAQSGEQLIVRTKDFLDNATPSGNSVAAELLLRLSILTGDLALQRQAVNIFRLNRDAIARYPSAFGLLLSALDFYLSTPKEIVIVGSPGAEDTRALAREVWKEYLPNKVIAQTAEEDERQAAVLPLLKDRPTVAGKATAYVCENYTCRQPVNDPQELAALLFSNAGKTRAGS
nr:thioredoxin domain-containing protein [Pyrinomonadaceae bacterium]